MKLGFACSWWRPIETTWSGVSPNLMRSLEKLPDLEVTRINGERNLLTAAALVASGRALGYGVWKHQALNQRLTDARIRREVRRSDIEAMVTVGDVETKVEVPTFLYQDANFSVIREYADLLHEYAPTISKFPAGRLDQLVEQQRANYQAAPHLLSFSTWFADWLVTQDGVAPERVHVVGGGLYALPSIRDLETRGASGTNVLFIGRDFFRKGGDLVVAAIEQLRKAGAGEFTLTVVGPAAWPLPAPVPHWVKFLGEVPASDVRALWADHDIFALPTWYEPYGLVFLEARAAGVPILARSAYCMPELVPDGTGRLIPADGGIEAVAEQLLAISKDTDLFAASAADRERTRNECHWDNVAERVATVVADAIS